jgi:putative ABC transport system permease protein
MDLSRDLRYALRALIRQPAFSLFAVVTLALGIGLNTAIFSVVKNVLLAPPPYPEADRIVRLFETTPQYTHGVVSPANYRAWEERDGVFAAIAAARGWSWHLTGAGGAERLWGRQVSPDFFRVMGVTPMLGRPLVTADVESGDAIAVIGHGLWVRQFGGDSSAVNGDVVLNGEAHRIVGVMPPGFAFPSGAEVWAPLLFSPEEWASRRSYFLTVIARLEADVSLSSAQAALDAVALQRARDFPDSNTDRGVKLERLHDTEVQSVRGHLWMLFGCVGLILVIACMNVANLLQSRAVARVREISIRAALGAGRHRLVRQLMVESLTLALLGGGAGIALAAAGVQLFGTITPSSFPRAHAVTIDASVLGYTLGISLFTSLLFGVLPAYRLSRLDIADALRATNERLRFGWVRLGQGLVVVETALALILVLAAGLLLRSFHQLTSQPIGLDHSSVLVAEVPLPWHQFDEPVDQAAFFSELLVRARALPGVKYAAASNNPPFSDRWYGMDMALDRGDGEPVDVSDAMTHTVTPEYFAAIGVPVHRGRTFQDADRSENTRVAIVNDQFVAQYLNERDPLGARLFVLRSETPVEIVGVVGTTKHRGMDDQPIPSVFFPMHQRPSSSMLVILRADTDPQSVAAPLVEEVRRLNAGVPVSEISTMTEMISRSLAQSRFYVIVLVVFAGTALLLACVGVYGLLSYLVAQRTREMGIRMALGARSAAVVRLVLARGLAMAVPGIALGLIAAYWLNRLLDSLLFEITPTDPVTYAAVTLLFVLLAIAASYGPARRGTRADPVSVLRAE